MSDLTHPKKTQQRLPATADCLRGILAFTGNDTPETTKLLHAIAKHEETGSPFVITEHTVPKLASHVARGEQCAAEAMFTQGLNPELALECTEVIGYTKLPAFVDTAVKYAAWARDHQMLWMIIDQIEAIPDITKRAELITELLKQFNEIPERFSLKPLIGSYRNYLTKYDDAEAGRCPWTDVDTAWLAIGVEQSKLPTNYAQYYCDPNLPLYPRPNASQLDSRAAARRSEILDFDNYSTRVVSQHWYAWAGLGINFTRGRGARAGAWAHAPARSWRAGEGVELGLAALRDFAAIDALDIARTMEILEISLYLTKRQLYLDSQVALTAPRSTPQI